MTTRKHADYLSLSQDAESISGGGDSDGGYNSEEHEIKVGRTSKRRKISRGDDLDSESEVDESPNGEDGSEAEKRTGNKAPRTEAVQSHNLDSRFKLDEDEEEEEHDEDDDAEELEDNRRPDSKRRSHELSPSLPKLKVKDKSTKKRKLKTGIIYLPRLPPFLKPSTLRTLLTPYTKHGISRLFLTPEAPAARRQRTMNGGNKKTLYTDGWVEFASKTDAKTVVDACNGKIIGGRKGGYYRDDVWSMRYLRGFKWGDLVGERRDEEAERNARLEAERRREKREMAVFLGNVEKSKIEETRRRKGEKKGAVGADSDEPPNARVFSFRQNEVKRKTGKEREKEKPAEEVRRVLSKIF